MTPAERLAQIKEERETLENIGCDNQGWLIERIETLEKALAEILDYGGSKDIREIRGGELKHIVYECRVIADNAIEGKSDENI